MKRIMVCVMALALAAGCLPFSACSVQKQRNIYKIFAEYADGELQAAVEFSFFNDTEEAFDELKFQLYGNAYREGAQMPPLSAAFASAYYEGKRYGQMEIESVSPSAGWELSGTDGTLLCVRLEEEVYPDESVTLTIEYTLTLAKVNHRTGIAERAVNLGNFYPILCAYERGKGFYECDYAQNGDPFYSACADYFVQLKAPAEYVAASSGQTVSASAEGASKVSTFELKNARDFAIVLSKDFEVLQTQAGDTQIAYYYYSDEEAEKTLRLIADCIAYFSKEYGAYAYETYSLVQTGFCFGGMEYPGLTYVSDALSSQDKLYAAAHETAHQWWYAAVGNNQDVDAWMDEGLAEYACVQFFAAREEYGIDADARIRAARTAMNALCNVQTQVFGQADTSMNRPLREYGAYEYVVLAYDKGLLLFETLEDALGASAVSAGLKRYYADFSGKTATPADLAASFRRAGALSIVQSFVDGTAVL